MREIKTEVEDIEFVEVDPHDVQQLCMACLCATRTTHMLDDVTMKQHYMNILAEMLLEGDVPALQCLRLCWECVAHLKRSARFRKQVQDSYRLLKPMLSMCDKEDLDEFLQSSVCRSAVRLRTCCAFSIDISPRDVDTLVMTADEDDDDNNEAAALEYLEINTEASAFRAKDLDEFALISKQVKNGVKTINTPNSTDIKLSTFICDYCYKRFSSKIALKRHISTYDIYAHNSKIVSIPSKECVVVLCSDNQCSECSNGLRLLQHINMKTNVAEKHYQSNVFHNLKSILNTKSLILHNNTHTGKNTFQCGVCHKPFSGKQKLVNHIRTHTGEKPFQCEMCRKSFAQQCTLIRHKRTHTGEKTFTCAMCHKSYAKKYDLVVHIRTHTGEKPFHCEVCHKSFSLKYNLTKHIRTHTGEKPFQCEVCHKSFALKCNLAKHLRTHIGEKPFLCEVCQTSFALKGNLIKHIRTHTGEKPFQCKVCLKSFAKKYDLEVHIRTHTGEKPFQCEVCHKYFTQKSTLIKHITKQHAS